MGWNGGPIRPLVCVLGALASVMPCVSSRGARPAPRGLGVGSIALLGCTTFTPRQSAPLGYLQSHSLLCSLFLFRESESSNTEVSLSGRSILLLIIYEGTGQGEVTNSINLSVRQLEGCVTNRPSCHLARDCLCWDCSPRIAMMTNVIDIFY